MKTNSSCKGEGSSSKMLSRTMARDSMLQAIRRGENIVATDPKGELYEDVERVSKNRN